MLRLSRRLDYAILALAHLADPTLVGPVSARAVSVRSRIPAAVLANILKDLSRLGVIRSVRGAHGGYELAVRPEELTVGELLRRMEGAPKLVECVPDGAGLGPSAEEGGCELQAACPVKVPLRKLHDRIHEVLDELSFDQLAVTGWSQEPLPAMPGPTSGSQQH